MPTEHTNAQIASEYRAIGGKADPGIVKLMLDLRDQVATVTDEKGDDIQTVANLFQTVGDHLFTALSSLGVRHEGSREDNQCALDNVLTFLLSGMFVSYINLTVSDGTCRVDGIEKCYKLAAREVIEATVKRLLDKPRRPNEKSS